ALKYSKAGVTPQLKITAESAGQNVRLKFSDNGIGISLEHVDKMFELFRRLHARDEYQGSGIGLAVCKKIAALHGGSIGVTSNLNEGSTFEVTLPIKQHVTSNLNPR
ncbi:MAG TPA: ATP-binding protein, partial [Chitinophagales bacterium]|nr:ATP-binding protein [Chitinophagales bacterium]